MKYLRLLGLVYVMLFSSDSSLSPAYEEDLSGWEM